MPDGAALLGSLLSSISSAIAAATPPPQPYIPIPPPSQPYINMPPQVSSYASYSSMHGSRTGAADYRGDALEVRRRRRRSSSRSRSPHPRPRSPDRRRRSWDHRDVRDVRELRFPPSPPSPPSFPPPPHPMAPYGPANDDVAPHRPPIACVPSSWTLSNTSGKPASERPPPLERPDCKTPSAGVAGLGPKEVMGAGPSADRVRTTTSMGGANSKAGAGAGPHGVGGAGSKAGMGDDAGGRIRALARAARVQLACRRSYANAILNPVRTEDKGKED